MDRQVQQIRRFDQHIDLPAIHGSGHPGREPCGQLCGFCNGLVEFQQQVDIAAAPCGTHTRTEQPDPCGCAGWLGSPLADRLDLFSGNTHDARLPVRLDFGAQPKASDIRLTLILTILGKKSGCVAHGECATSSFFYSVAALADAPYSSRAMLPTNSLNRGQFDNTIQPIAKDPIQ